MIEFELTEDHQALKQTVREFAQKEVAPYIKEWDEKQHFERGIFEKMAALNLWARFLYEPLCDDRVRRIQETDDPQFGREVCFADDDSSLELKEQRNGGSVIGHGDSCRNRWLVRCL